MANYEFAGKRSQIGRTSFFSVVGDWAIVGEGAVVRGEVPDGKIAVGVPAQIIGDVTEKHKAEWQAYKDRYAELAATRYPASFKRIG